MWNCHVPQNVNVCRVARRVSAALRAAGVRGALSITAFRTSSSSPTLRRRRSSPPASSSPTSQAERRGMAMEAASLIHGPSKLLQIGAMAAGCRMRSKKSQS
ncbi:uncharacterized protein LOC123395442 [Hordeum vulgare subsp. vulgare]|uniref:uncharacterized protein LOC123395442 n=1 Tax=Hordeum vulgare subsp. vulgare TaxID=112509 RepID=UPI00162DBAB5|nr:uncharacterized protein LOC123395442 [Hordeum vulgare subsp. vulgare]